MELVILLGSLAVVSLGAEMLVRGASVLAMRAGLSPLFVGLTLVGFGTSSPELAASVAATLRGSTDVSVGNVVGSNIFNIAVVLGLTALVSPIHLRLAAIRRDLALAMVAATVPGFGVLFSGRVPSGMGLVLLGVLAVYLWTAYRAARRSRPEDEILAGRELESTFAIDPAAVKMRDRAWFNFGLSLAGLAMLVVGAREFVNSAVELAGLLGISGRVIGLTVVAVGTSLPEMVTSLVAARRRNPEIAVGNVIGSNIFNSFGILGISAVVAPQTVAWPVVVLDVPVTILATVALVPILKTGGRISRAEGAMLLLGYCAWVAVLFTRTP